VTVDGMTGPITDLNVTLHRFGHTYPSDVRILLVGPSGKAVSLMDGRCGSDDIEDFTWIFDQGAAAPLTSGAGPCDGFVYQPSGRAGSVLPAPAPAGPYATSLTPSIANRRTAPGGSSSQTGARTTRAISSWAGRSR
jgi:hypothetical protein